jgi:hypothetical protein
VAQEPEGSSPHSQQPSTGHCPGPVYRRPSKRSYTCGRVARLFGGALSQQVLGVTLVERQSASCQSVAVIILRLYRSRLT